MDEEKYIIDTVDYRGKRVVFTERKWREKSEQHPELLKSKFLKNLKKTIETPQIVWQDYADPKKKRCYYWKYSVTTYIKVIIFIFDNPCNVVSAFEVDYIKESQYPNLKNFK